MAARCVSFKTPLLFDYNFFTTVTELSYTFRDKSVDLVVFCGKMKIQIQERVSLPGYRERGSVHNKRGADILKVYRNSSYQRRLFLRRVGIIGGGIAVALVLAVAIILLVNNPIGDIPVADPNASSAASSDTDTTSSDPGSSEPPEPQDSSSDASSSEGSDSSADSSTSSTGDGDWTPPAPPADGAAYTKLYPELYCPPSTGTYEKEKVIFLTFDDGPSSNTDRILDVLKEKGVKATFFVTAQNASEANMARMKRIVDEGHTIGIHSYTHEYHQIYASVSAYLDDFNKMYQKIYEITGVKPNIFRFPGGSNTGYNKSIRDDLVKEMTRRGFTFYDWNIDSSDASGNNVPASKLVSHTLSTSQGFNFGIVLMHDLGTKATTADALPQIIDGLKEQGYSFDKITNDLPSVNFLPKNKS